MLLICVFLKDDANPKPHKTVEFLAYVIIIIIIILFAQ